MSESLDTQLRKRLAGECQHCASPAADGSDYCEKHDAIAKAGYRRRRHRARVVLASKGLCSDGCGRRVGKRRRADGQLVFTRCPGCNKKRKAKQKERRDKRRVLMLDRGVTTSAVEDQPSGNWRPDPNRDGELAWMRYRGKGRRGRLTREEQIEEFKRDVLTAKKKLEEGLARLDRYKAEVADLPAIQRDAAWRLALDPIAFAGRLIDGVVGEEG